MPKTTPIWPDDNIEVSFTSDPTDERDILELGATVGFIDKDALDYCSVFDLAEVVPLTEHELYSKAFLDIQASYERQGDLCSLLDPTTMLVKLNSKDLFFRLVRRRVPS